MKLGLGLYRHMLTPDQFRFARQIGVTHIVAHLVDYFKGGAHTTRDNQPTGAKGAWGVAGDPEKLWTVEELVALRKNVEAAGLKLEAIENFDPAHWHDVLLGGPKKCEQLENVKTIIQRLGEAGIPIMGYNFSIAGVCGRSSGPYARGGAESVGVFSEFNEPMPNGMAWNMVYDENAPAGNVPPATPDELWGRLEEFLRATLPVAEAAGVKLAAHPDDPPLPTMRGQPRLVFQPKLYQRLLDISPSRANTLEFCIGTLAEMPDADVYETVAHYARQGRLGYVHFRNIHGRAPNYHETFVDDGDVDMLRVLRILKESGFDGVIIPDHSPQVHCAAPWHAGMAHALGYLAAGLQSLK